MLRLFPDRMDMNHIRFAHKPIELFSQIGMPTKGAGDRPNLRQLHAGLLEPLTHFRRLPLPPGRQH